MATRVTEWIEIEKGPSIEMLFDALRLGRRYGQLAKVSFLLRHSGGNREPVTVIVTSIGFVKDGSPDDWQICVRHSEGDYWTAVIEFNTLTRTGRMQFQFDNE